MIWLNWGLTDDDLAVMPASVQRGFSRTLIHGASADDKVARLGLGGDLGDGKGRCLVKGSWNADIYEPLKRFARPGDVHCDKNRMSGMWSPEQPLRRYLDGGGAGVRTLLFAGVNTDQCVLGTLTDAYNGGWDCVMVEDCCGTKTPGAPEVCLYNVAVSHRSPPFGFESVVATTRCSHGTMSRLLRLFVRARMGLLSTAIRFLRARVRDERILRDVIHMMRCQPSLPPPCDSTTFARRERELASE